MVNCKHCGKKIGILEKWERTKENTAIHTRCSSEYYSESAKEQRRIAEIEREAAEEQKDYVERITGRNIKKKDKNVYFSRLMHGETETSARGGLESLQKSEPSKLKYTLRPKKRKTQKILSINWLGFTSGLIGLTASGFIGCCFLIVLFIGLSSGVVLNWETVVFLLIHFIFLVICIVIMILCTRAIYRSLWKEVYE